MVNPKKLILTAGSDTTGNEKKYTSDAAVNGWNEHAFDYIEKFEKEFAKYVGAKYAMVLAGGTCALQLALYSLNIKAGDEVILPDMTYFACSDVVRILGATPIFVDILPDTWCIDPEKMKEAITPRTKAIMPVDIYGNPHEMKVIKEIADDHNLYIVEDACPAIGAKYHSMHVGALADYSCYSFQGAKIMTTGTGGMLTTNNEELFLRAKHLSDHGEAKGYWRGFRKKFWQLEVGWEFDMSNLQAAFGLAQLERIEKFVSKKRKIFDWYFSRLKDIESISFNYERRGTRSNRWMSSIILNKKFKFTRDELMKKLKNEMIDTRPFFYPISMFPIYEEQNTPIAHHIGLNGINLPSGLKLTEEEIDYVCRVIKKLLN